MPGPIARSHDVADPLPADAVRLDNDPVPNEKPIAMNAMSAVTLSAASTLPTMRPGPTPRTWMAAIIAMSAIATSACGDTVNGTQGSGTTSSGVLLDASGTKRPR